MNIYGLVVLARLEEIKQRLAKQPELVDEPMKKKTPLMAAARYCNVEIFEFLLSQSADIYIRNSYNENVLQMLIIQATWMKSEDKDRSKKLGDYYTMIAMLLRRDAELRAENPMLISPLEIKSGEELRTSFGRTWTSEKPATKEIIEKIKIMAKAAEVQIQRERDFAGRKHGVPEDAGLHCRGSSYFKAAPQALETLVRRPKGFARLLEACGINRRTTTKGYQPLKSEETSSLEEQNQGKLKVS